MSAEQTLPEVGGNFADAINRTSENYMVAQRFVLTGAGELGQFSKEALAAAGSAATANTLAMTAIVTGRIGSRPESDAGANWIVAATVTDTKQKEKIIDDTFDACFEVQESTDVLPALRRCS